MRWFVLVAATALGCHDPAAHSTDAHASDGSVATDGAAGSDGGGTITLATPVKKQIFLEMVNSAEQSALDWTTAYPYCEDIHDGRGYTTGIAGFTTDSAKVENGGKHGDGRERKTQEPVEDELPVIRAGRDLGVAEGQHEHSADETGPADGAADEFGFGHRGQEETGEEGEDRDDDQQFDQCDGASFRAYHNSSGSILYDCRVRST